MKVITEYQCEICGRRYPTEMAAKNCERIPFKPQFKTGQIVMFYREFGWFDGDRKWVEKCTVAARKEKRMRFYYVVTYVDRDPRYLHRVRYHIATKAMTGRQGYHIGYTFDQGHYTPTVVKNPPKYVVKTSEDLLGEKADSLL